MREIRKVAVYLGSSNGTSPKYKETAFALGAALAKHNCAVIYGGAGIGTMKSLADGALSEGGKVKGVIPAGFIEQIHHKHPNREVQYNALEDVIIVANMSERKQTMESLSDCCIALPGGCGTMDELFEYIVDYQLGYHDKPLFILNLDGFFDPIKDLLQNMRKAGFVNELSIEYIKFVPSVDALQEELFNFKG